MSIVSPITACSAIVPVALSLASGERPSALAGAIVASVEKRAADGRGRQTAVVLAVAAALTIGVFVYFLGRAARDDSVLSALLGARVGALTLLLVWTAATGATLRVSRRAVSAIVLVGLADVSANALFALASQRGLLAVVSVLGSLFPVVTVVLAHLFLRERVSGVQRLGVIVTLIGVAIASVA